MSSAMSFGGGGGRGSYEVGHVERLHSAQVQLNANSGVWGSSYGGINTSNYGVPAEPMSPAISDTPSADPRGSYFNFSGPGNPQSGPTGNTPRLINAQPIGSALKPHRFSVTDLSGNFNPTKHNTPRLKSMRQGGGTLNQQMAPTFPPAAASAGMGSAYGSSYGSEYGTSPVRAPRAGSIADMANTMPAQTLNVGGYVEPTPNSQQQQQYDDPALAGMPMVGSDGNIRLSSFELNPLDLAGLAPLREMSGAESSSDMGYLAVNGIGPAYTSTDPHADDEMIEDTKL